MDKVACQSEIYESIISSFKDCQRKYNRCFK